MVRPATSGNSVAERLSLSSSAEADFFSAKIYMDNGNEKPFMTE
jgi:hypothetical protein